MASFSNVDSPSCYSDNSDSSYPTHLEVGNLVRHLEEVEEEDNEVEREKSGNSRTNSYIDASYNWQIHAMEHDHNHYGHFYLPSNCSQSQSLQNHPQFIPQLLPPSQPQLEPYSQLYSQIHSQFQPHSSPQFQTIHPNQQLTLSAELPTLPNNNASTYSHLQTTNHYQLTINTNKHPKTAQSQQNVAPALFTAISNQGTSKNTSERQQKQGFQRKKNLNLEDALLELARGQTNLPETDETKTTVTKNIQSHLLQSISYCELSEEESWGRHRRRGRRPLLCAMCSPKARYFEARAYEHYLRHLVSHLHSRLYCRHCAGYIEGGERGLHNLIVHLQSARVEHAQMLLLVEEAVNLGKNWPTLYCAFVAQGVHLDTTLFPPSSWCTTCRLIHRNNSSSEKGACQSKTSETDSKTDQETTEVEAQIHRPVVDLKTPPGAFFDHLVQHMFYFRYVCVVCAQLRAAEFASAFTAPGSGSFEVFRDVTVSFPQFSFSLRTHIACFHADFGEMPPSRLFLQRFMLVGEIESALEEHLTGTLFDKRAQELELYTKADVERILTSRNVHPADPVCFEARTKEQGTQFPPEKEPEVLKQKMISSEQQIVTSTTAESDKVELERAKKYMNGYQGGPEVLTNGFSTPNRSAFWRQYRLNLHRNVQEVTKTGIPADELSEAPSAPHVVFPVAPNNSRLTSSSELDNKYEKNQIAHSKSNDTEIKNSLLSENSCRLSESSENTGKEDGEFGQGKKMNAALFELENEDTVSQSDSNRQLHQRIDNLAERLDDVVFTSAF